MKKTLLYKALLACWAILVLASCDLDLQKNYDYERLLHTNRIDVYLSSIE